MPEISTAFSNVVDQMAEDVRSISSLNDEKLTESAFLAAARGHAEMIRIHPFIDGNGRWARSCDWRLSVRLRIPSRYSRGGPHENLSILKRLIAR